MALVRNDVVSASKAISSGADVNRQDMMGLYAMNHAVSQASEKMVRLLIDSGFAYPKESHHGRAYWAEAVADGSKEIAKLLVQSGVRPNFSTWMAVVIVKMYRVFKVKK